MVLRRSDVRGLNSLLSFLLRLRASCARSRRASSPASLRGGFLRRCFCRGVLAQGAAAAVLSAASALVESALICFLSTSTRSLIALMRSVCTGSGRVIFARRAAAHEDEETHGDVEPEADRLPEGLTAWLDRSRLSALGFDLAVCSSSSWAAVAGAKIINDRYPVRPTAQRDQRPCRCAQEAVSADSTKADAADKRRRGRPAPRTARRSSGEGNRRAGSRGEDARRDERKKLEAEQKLSNEFNP